MDAATRTGKTLLVVEDDDLAREGLAVVLRRAGYTVALVSDGQQALDYLRDHPPPDLILLDMLMPVLDGWHFLESLQRARTATSVPVLITTGTILTREWAQAHGCAGFVHKPIKVDALLEEVRRCLATPAG